MLEDKVGSLPVLEQGRVVGIVTETDVLRQICRADQFCSPEVAEIVVWPSARSVSFYRRAGFGSEEAPLLLDLAGD